MPNIIIMPSVDSNYDLNLGVCRLNFQAVAEGYEGNIGFTCTMPFDIPNADKNVIVINEAISECSNLGIIVGPTDRKDMFGKFPE